MRKTEHIKCLDLYIRCRRDEEDYRGRAALVQKWLWPMAGLATKSGISEDFRENVRDCLIGRISYLNGKANAYYEMCYDFGHAGFVNNEEADKVYGAEDLKLYCTRGIALEAGTMQKVILEIYNKEEITPTKAGKFARGLAAYFKDEARPYWEKVSTSLKHCEQKTA